MADRHAGEKNAPSTVVADATSAAPDYEGACRHLVADRMGITGARWGLPGAQAILWLRAIRTNGDLTTYWDRHIDRERQRNHLSRYQDSLGLAA